MRQTLRQAWELDDAEKAERLIRNLARRLEQMAPGVSASILEGIDELLTVIRLGLPIELRRSLACTNIIENMMGTHPARLPQREALARCLDGAALDRGGDAGSGQGVPPAESAQATAGAARRTRSLASSANKQLGR